MGLKLVIQIPCYNEEENLPRTVASIPRRIDGVDSVEILVVDDGSQDRTAEVARECGVDIIVRHRRNRGLALAFQTGIDAALRHGADIIVNTDADNQYNAEDIGRLIRPILDGTADVVIGDRQVDKVSHFSLRKRSLQKLGSAVVGHLAGLRIPDAVSGFRAITREAALQTNIVTQFSYTTEMLIMAGKRRMAVVSVPVRTNATTRESRLFRSIPHFITNTGITMLRSYALYNPLRTFVSIGLAAAAVGFLPVIRFLYYYFTGDGAGHIQSLVLGVTLILIGFISFLFGLIADLIGRNRQLLEISLTKLREFESRLDELGSKDR